LTDRFSHPLLGTVVKGPFGPQLRSASGTRPLTASIAQLEEVAERLAPWPAPQLELRVRVDLGNHYPETGGAVAIDETGALIKGVARRTGEPSRSRRKHGFEWHVCGDVLALREGVFLRVLAPTARALWPWLEECAASQLRCSFPLLRAAGQAPPAPEPGWLDFRDDYTDAPGRAALSDAAVHLDLPLGRGERLRQSVVGFLCAAEDPETRTLALPPRALDAAARWLCRVHAPEDPARLAAWLLDNGGSEALAGVAREAEASFGGLRSVDRTQRFGGIHMLEAALAAPKLADWPLQQAPAGAAVLMSLWDIDQHDTLACAAEDGSMWRYTPHWDEWQRSSDSVRTFVARLALWGHPHDVQPIHMTSSPLGQALARELGLEEIAEASDSTGTFYAGEPALVFERRTPDGTTTHLRALRPEAALAWDALAS
jgi:hypothetical protein